jgi:hypothetical protein
MKKISKVFVGLTIAFALGGGVRSAFADSCNCYLPGYAVPLDSKNKCKRNPAAIEEPDSGHDPCNGTCAFAIGHTFPKQKCPKGTVSCGQNPANPAASPSCGQNGEPYVACPASGVGTGVSGECCKGSIKYRDPDKPSLNDVVGDFNCTGGCVYKDD